MPTPWLRPPNSHLGDSRVAVQESAQKACCHGLVEGAAQPEQRHGNHRPQHPWRRLGNMGQRVVVNGSRKACVEAMCCLWWVFCCLDVKGGWGKLQNIDRHKILIATYLFVNHSFPLCIMVQYLPSPFPGKIFKLLPVHYQSLKPIFWENSTWLLKWKSIRSSVRKPKPWNWKKTCMWRHLWHT